MISWLRKHKFESHLTAFLSMVVASIGLYFASANESPGLTWGLLTLFVLANLLAILVK